MIKTLHIWKVVIEVVLPWSCDYHQHDNYATHYI